MGEVLVKEEPLLREVDASPDVSSSSDTTGEKHQELSESEHPETKTQRARSLLQLDVELEKLEWVTTYLKYGNTDGVPGSLQDTTHSSSTHSKDCFMAELALKNLSASLNVDSDVFISSKLCLMDLTLQEIPFSSGDIDRCTSGSAEGAYIVHQSLYYRKIKSPRCAGGAMDTQRSSSKDMVLQAAISYCKKGIQGGDRKLL